MLIINHISISRFFISSSCYVYGTGRAAFETFMIFMISVSFLITESSSQTQRIMLKINTDIAI